MISKKIKPLLGLILILFLKKNIKDKASQRQYGKFEADARFKRRSLAVEQMVSNCCW